MCPCPDGTYETADKTCADCAYQCETCVTSPDLCLTCKASRVTEHVCECPDGEFDVGVAECADCDEQCETCIEYSDYCLVCSGERTPPPTCPIPPDVAQSAKIEDIPVGSAKVFACADACLTCSNTATNCDICDVNRDQDQAPSCPCLYGFYEENGVCVECPYQCDDCSSAEICTVCAGNR